MARKRFEKPRRKLKPLYIVFCEGETEAAYIIWLKQKYRIPIEIKTKVTGQNISNKYIEGHTKQIRNGITSKLDKSFLIYDYESSEFLDRLKKITKGFILLSNPNIELWFLLHYREQRASINGQNCIRDLKVNNTNYEKGKLNKQLKEKLNEQIMIAVERAKALTEFKNPSSTVYKLIELLEFESKQLS